MLLKKISLMLLFIGIFSYNPINLNANFGSIMPEFGGKIILDHGCDIGRILYIRTPQNKIKTYMHTAATKNYDHSTKWSPPSRGQNIIGRTIKLPTPCTQSGTYTGEKGYPIKFNGTSKKTLGII